MKDWKQKEMLCCETQSKKQTDAGFKLSKKNPVCKGWGEGFGYCCN